MPAAPPNPRLDGRGPPQHHVVGGEPASTEDIEHEVGDVGVDLTRDLDHPPAVRPPMTTCRTPATAGRVGSRRPRRAPPGRRRAGAARLRQPAMSTTASGVIAVIGVASVPLGPATAGTSTIARRRHTAVQSGAAGSPRQNARRRWASGIAAASARPARRRMSVAATRRSSAMAIGHRVVGQRAAVAVGELVVPASRPPPPRQAQQHGVVPCRVAAQHSRSQSSSTGPSAVITTLPGCTSPWQTTRSAPVGPPGVAFDARRRARHARRRRRRRPRRRAASSSCHHGNDSPGGRGSRRAGRRGRWRAPTATIAPTVRQSGSPIDGRESLPRRHGERRRRRRTARFAPAPGPGRRDRRARSPARSPRRPVRSAARRAGPPDRLRRWRSSPRARAPADRGATSAAAAAAAVVVAATGPGGPSTKGAGRVAAALSHRARRRRG